MAAAGSHRGLSFIEKDVRNYITREVRNIFQEDDAKEFGKYLLRMKEKNQNFFFELNLEGDHCIKYAFWADARSRAACEYFGGVVSFDTTYNTNRYNMVLGYFVGMNHHGQSTLRGCALMKNEDIRSFKWLFECWLRCMGGKAPKETGTIFSQSMASEGTSGFQSCTRIAYMDSGLLESPLLGRNEKHTKEREHAFIFQQVHHMQQLLKTIREAIRQLPSKQRAKR
ncbi:hypothetical protein Ahy_A10g050789 [Arachis hypogaea]|uniref:MULE transposase domain-containing protein n=1 Tax=Arachis hypogaea TaxID=3818 RepID=A0A445BAG1_ARAHY|nr:hypothetical protein Ahy_A10g050789 [Arachis hypogaea]